MQAWWIFIGIACVLLLVKPLRCLWLVPLSAKIDAHVKWSGNAAQMASAVIALIGFTVVIYQIVESREKVARDAIRAELGDARRLYLSYSEATLRYPELTEPDYATLARSRAEFIRYKKFVEHMVYAYDDVLNSVRLYEGPEDVKAWEASFKYDVLPHRRFLCHAGIEFYSQYRAKMGQDIKTIIAPCQDVPPVPLPDGYGGAGG